MQSLLALVAALLLLPPAIVNGSSPYGWYADCAPTTLACGNLSIQVGYPFRLDSNRSDHCGYPGFLLSCLPVPDPPSIMITIASYAYRVKAVDYSNHLLTLVDPFTAAGPSSCSRLPYRNTTLDHSLYDFTDRNQNLTVFINCSAAAATSHYITPALHHIPCLSNSSDPSNGNRSYFTVGTKAIPALSDSCSSTLLVPVSQTAADGMLTQDADFSKELQQGFIVRWLAGRGWCRNCNDSGGICGYDYTSPANQTCYCPYGMERGICHMAHTDPARKGHTKAIVLGSSLGATGLILAFGLCLFLYLCMRSRYRSISANLFTRPALSELSSKDPELGSINYHTHIFSYNELQVATNGFDASRELGDGGFGTVYKGHLRDGRVVAVKRLYENNYKRVEQFLNEVYILSRLHHQNLVTLYGCTSRHSRELLLVYEFVSNGTVADHLHGARAAEGALTWPIRLGIAIETAGVLAYLHTIEPQIIHRDMKTNNILLDNSFHVKVGDFGLSRLFPADATHVSTLPQGTPGYVDPEYHQCYQLTDKSDVYSFGVVLVELISSKPAVDISRHRHEINLANMAVTKIQNHELEQLVDPWLGYGSDFEKEKMITMVAELAFRCLQGDREARPSIMEVLEDLRGIQNGGCKTSTGLEIDAQTREEARLLKNLTPYSPDSVTTGWESKMTTPNSSGKDNVVS